MSWPRVRGGRPPLSCHDYSAAADTISNMQLGQRLLRWLSLPYLELEGVCE